MENYMLMKHNEHGWHNASGLEVEDMIKNGWIEVKEKKVEIVEDKAVIIAAEQEAPVKGKPGRKPNKY